MNMGRCHCSYSPLWIVLYGVVTTAGLVQSFTPPKWQLHRSTNPGLAPPPRDKNNVALLAVSDIDDSSVFTQDASVVFSELVVGGSAVGLEEIRQGWDELQEIISEGDLLSSELEDLFTLACSKAPGTNTDKLNEAGFAVLYESIDSLFFFDGETDGDVKADEKSNEHPEKTVVAPQTFWQEELLTLLSAMNSDTVNRLPCGFDCTDKERALIQKLVNELELEPTNWVQLNKGKIDAKKVIGEWEMLYTSSRTMTINKSLSGLGRSASTLAPFVRLVQRFTGSKFYGKCEYIETFGTGSESFDVTITGEWMVKDGANPLTGMSSTVLWVEPEKVKYGLSTNDAETWASLGPIKRLDIIYMKDDLLITRGNVNQESIIVFQRTTPS